ncbi:hypothetical protein BC834DRAFT_906665 [Gloeopeniophorella convolvens]|nr:hypothetical protein BC834DRAFT_906665 [Gloeopeniophorella convolvens]
MLLWYVDNVVICDHETALKLNSCSAQLGTVSTSFNLLAAVTPPPRVVFNPCPHDIRSFFVSGGCPFYTSVAIMRFKSSRRRDVGIMGSRQMRRQHITPEAFSPPPFRATKLGVMSFYVQSRVRYLLSIRCRYGPFLSILSTISALNPPTS